MITTIQQPTSPMFCVYHENIGAEEASPGMLVQITPVSPFSGEFAYPRKGHSQPCGTHHRSEHRPGKKILASLLAGPHCLYFLDHQQNGRNEQGATDRDAERAPTSDNVLLYPEQTKFSSDIGK